MKEKDEKKKPPVSKKESPEKKEKTPKSRYVTVKLPLVPLLVVLALLAGWIFLSREFGPGLGIVKTKRESASQTLEVKSRDLARFFTLEFVWKTVFPHDFFPPQNEWDAFLQKKRNYLPMTSADAELNRLYSLCEETGFSPRRENTDFMVLTVVIKAGYDWEETPLWPAGESVGEAAASTEAGTAGPVEVRDKEIILEIPRVRILQTVLEDPERASYLFPDVRVSPESLRKIAAYVSSQAEELAAERNLLDRAEEHGRSFLTELFTKAGFEKVSFR